MLVTLLAWVYITFLCWTWGLFFVRGGRKLREDQPLDLPHFSIVCIAGLACVTALNGMLSLFLPLGSLLAQLINLGLVVTLFVYMRAKLLFTGLHIFFTRLYPISFFLLFACLALVIIMSCWQIVHPDTLGYHAQTIQWIEKYKATAGLVHLHTRLGYQGLWFADNALFSFRFTGIEAFTFLNTTVLCWFIIFVVHKIDQYIVHSPKSVYGLLWLVLLGIAFWDYTQVRLTATSASPDFIATITVLLIFYLLFAPSPPWLLILFLCAFALTIKLSTLPIIIVAVFAVIRLLREKRFSHVIIGCALGLIVLTPFFARNIITSGWVVFPFSSLDIVQADWKFDPALTSMEKDYITAYARVPVDHEKNAIADVINMPVRGWIKEWWQNKSYAQQAMLIVMLASVLLLIIRIGALIKRNAVVWVAIVTSIAGIAFWFLQAPDPRFGAGFILALPAILLTTLYGDKHSRIVGHIVWPGAILAGLLVTVYVVYRLMFFFSPSHLLKPEGIDKTNRIIYEPREHVKMRGKTIQQGFKSSQ
jgi:hypothetical protein